MATSAVAVGLGMAALGIAGRYALRYVKVAQHAIKKFDVLSSSKYYKGGFEPTMSKREASLILGVSSSADQTIIAKAAKKLTRLNHPDIGGSPYLAHKIGEAVGVLKNK